MNHWEPQHISTDAEVAKKNLWFFERNFDEKPTNMRRCFRQKKLQELKKQKESAFGLSQETVSEASDVKDQWNRFNEIKQFCDYILFFSRLIQLSAIE